MALILGLTDGLTFFLDEWSIILGRQDWSLDSLLEPHNEHIYLGPVVVYKLLLGIFGMESTLPFQLVNGLFVVLVAWLVFVYLRSRVGGWPALFAAAVLLFLGAAWEDLLWPAGISFMGAIAAGVGALLVLDREPRPNDVLASVLLVVSVCFSSLGLVFAAGAAADVLTRGGGWLRRAYLPLAPVLLYVVWYLAYGQDAESAASLDNFLDAPRYIWEAAGGALASLLGLVAVDPEAFGAVHNLEWGRPLAVGLAIGLVWLAWRRPAAMSPQFWVIALTAGSFWFLAALNAIPGREPGASRYQLIGSVLLLLGAAELFRGARLARRATWGLAVLATASVVSNIGALRNGEEFLRGESDLAEADLTALELAREHLDPSFALTPEVAGTPFLANVSASAYFEAVDRWGSPAGSTRELAQSSEEARASADSVLAAALGLELTAEESITAAGSEEACEVIASESGSATPIELPAGGATIEPEAGSVQLRLRRFAEADYPVDLGTIDGPASLTIPTDSSTRPWVAEIAGDAPTTMVCAG